MLLINIEMRDDMDMVFHYQDYTYEEPATGWVDGVYYPRLVTKRNSHHFLREENGFLVVRSRVWREIEETGYGIFYYEESTQFITEWKGTNYEVRITFVNPTLDAYTCHIRVNDVVKEEAVTVQPGEEVHVLLIACMTNGICRLCFAAGAMSEIEDSVITGEVYIKDITVTPEEEKQRREKPRLFLVSDSTVQSYEKRFYPQTGWGQVLYQFFDGADRYREYRAEHSTYSLARTYELPELTIENRSIGGRSARSFYDEGKLDQILEIICPGDYMFVQFAHNDATAIRPNRYIAPDEFPYYIQRYIDACKRRQVQCVLVTPVAMRTCGEDGVFSISFAAYRESMIEIAREQKVPLLDLGARSTAYLNQIGTEESKHIYLWVKEGEYPDGAYAAGVSDKAHLQEYGAKVYANMIAEMLVEYHADHSLDLLKKLAAPKKEIEKPKPYKEMGEGQEKPTDMVSGFVVQEISNENGRGSFLLNWNLVEHAVAYHVYRKKKEELTFEVVRTVTEEEKRELATLPFTADLGYVWQYYITAVFENGSEGHASRLLEVAL